MNQLRLFLLLSMVAVISTVNAQDIAYGFKAGLNFNRILADAEMDDAGATVETFSGKTGFHVGATFTWKATDLMGLRGELMFSQKGYKRRYEGASYYDVTTDNGTVVNFGSGSRKMFISNANSYIDIPVMGYAKLFKWLEVHVGANIGLLVSSTAIGDLEFSGDSNGSAVDIAYDLDYKYGSDNAGSFDAAAEPTIITVNNSPYTLPNTAGAYYEYPKKNGNFHNFLDLGIVGGFSFYLNKGLYVGIRGNYGLTDLTNDDADFSFLKKDTDGNFIKTNDKDRNFSVQTSVGFSF